MTKIYLDNERLPRDSYEFSKNTDYLRDNWIVLRSYEAFCKYIKNNLLPNVISFDHDLADEHYKYAISDYIPYDEFKVKTGYHCLLFLVLHCAAKNLALPQILIHTMNRQGERNMQNLIDAYSAVRL